MRRLTHLNRRGEAGDEALTQLERDSVSRSSAVQPIEQDWVNRVVKRFAYNVRFLPVSPQHSIIGSPTQMGVFISAT